MPRRCPVVQQALNAQLVKSRARLAEARRFKMSPDNRRKHQRIAR